MLKFTTWLVLRSCNGFLAVIEMNGNVVSLNVVFGQLTTKKRHSYFRDSHFNMYIWLLKTLLLGFHERCSQLFLFWSFNAVSQFLSETSQTEVSMYISCCTQVVNRLLYLHNAYCDHTFAVILHLQDSFAAIGWPESMHKVVQCLWAAQDRQATYGV